VAIGTVPAVTCLCVYRSDVMGVADNKQRLGESASKDNAYK